MKKFNIVIPIIAVIIFSFFVIGFKQEPKVNIPTGPLLEKKDVNVFTLNKTIKTKTENSFVKEYLMFEIADNSTPHQNELLNKATSLRINNRVRSELLKTKDSNISIVVPLENGNTIKFLLTKVDVISDGFTLETVDRLGSKPAVYYDGLHYRGIIEGKENSLASISIFKDFLMGIASDESGNYVLGSVQKENEYTDNYIFYNDNDLKVLNEFKCGIEEDHNSDLNVYSQTDYTSNLPVNDNPDVERTPVKVYFVCDYEMYLMNNSDVQLVTNFVTGMFNAVATIYQMESIDLQISSITVYIQPDPYRFYNNSISILFAFGNNIKDNFPGDLAHLLSTRPINAGGIAWINVLCASYSGDPFLPYGRFGYSNIENSYHNYPVYSWTVNVVAHQIGHNFGSQHTHACIWPIGGGIGAIDSCYSAEGNCFSGSQKSIGTIMSYCHLWSPSGDTIQGGGINFARGFGQLPGDTIRLRYRQAQSCLTSIVNNHTSEIPSSFSLEQNFPNPFNPNTLIRYNIAKASDVKLEVFDITGRKINSLVNSFQTPGTYQVNFNAMYLSSGTYFYVLQAGDFIEVRKMVVVR